MNSILNDKITKINEIINDFEGLRTPSLKLFMSFDLIGSTAFKHSHNAKTNFTEVWYEFFKKFYTEIPHYLAKEYKKLSSVDIDFSTITKDTNLSSFTLPYLWKNLGDEMIYVADISDTKHVIYHIEAIQKAIVSHNKNLDTELKIQGTAWIAGFPVINAIIFDNEVCDIKTSQTEIVTNKEIDFIGPTIDLGFRIGKFSSERKLVLSTSLVFLLLNEIKQDSQNKFQDIFTFYFDGLQNTKGIHNGEYPIIWIDNMNGNDSKEEKLYGIDKKPCEQELLLPYIEEYIITSNDNIAFPFIYEEMSKKIIKGLKTDQNIETSFDKFCELYIKNVPKIYGKRGKVKSDTLKGIDDSNETLNKITSEIENLNRNQSE